MLNKLLIKGCNVLLKTCLGNWISKAYFNENTVIELNLFIIYINLFLIYPLCVAIKSLSYLLNKYDIFFQNDSDMYGVDREEPTPFSADEPDRVEIPESLVVHCQHLDPLQRSDVYGTDLYETAKQLLLT